jgi:hypothetical protein
MFIVLFALSWMNKKRREKDLNGKHAVRLHNNEITRFKTWAKGSFLVTVAIIADDESIKCFDRKSMTLCQSGNAKSSEYVS